MFNKFLIVTLFVFGVLLIPASQVSATYFIMEEIDDGGGGGGGGGGTDPDLTYAPISLNVNLDQSAYIGAGTITATASAVVNVCSNNVSHLTIKAKILSSTDAVIGSIRTILDEDVAGGSDTGIRSTTFTAPSTAPSGQTGNYKVRFEAIRTSLPGYSLMNGTITLTSLFQEEFARYSTGQSILVDVDNVGIIMDVVDKSNLSSISLNDGEILVSSTGEMITVQQIISEVLSTVTHDISFTVPPPTVNVFVNNSDSSPQSINAGSTAQIYWEYRNANRCTCAASRPIKFNSSTATPGTSCGESTISSGLNNLVRSTTYPLYEVDGQTVFSVVCNNN